VPTHIPLNRGLKQGSILFPILFNIFFGLLTGEFEKRCAEATSNETVLGVKVQYNLDDGFMDDSRIQSRNPGMRAATIVDVLYADDRVLFTNTISAMQIMIVIFDDVATLFGMELAINKTKIVCNQYSMAMGTATTGDALPHNTRGSQALARMQISDASLFLPVILIRGEKIEVVPQFRYLGVLDTDDGAVGMEIQARMCRMKQRFKCCSGVVSSSVSLKPTLHHRRRLRRLPKALGQSTAVPRSIFGYSYAVRH
jgi:hypothetical protein